MGVTVTIDDPLLPSLVAVMVTEPPKTPATRPVGDTVALLPSLDVQVIVRPVRIPPSESRNVAVMRTVSPWKIFAVVGAVVTVRTGRRRVSSAVSAFPSLVATILADPESRAITSPLFDGDAFAGLLLVHEITRPVRTLPLESRSTTANCLV
jgi:hypothetical protein